MLNNVHCERMTSNFLASKTWQHLSGILKTKSSQVAFMDSLCRK